MFGYLRRRRRARLRAAPAPETWRALLKERVPLYRRVPEPLRAALHGHMQVFLAEKHFEGCGGQTIDEPVRLIVAAQACLLLLGRDDDCFPGLHSILVYPGAFVAVNHEPDEDGLVWEEDVREGESWDRGAVVLSWEDLERDMKRLNGRNVVLHEFGHFQHFTDGALEDGPFPGHRAWQAEWCAVMSRQFERHQRAVERGVRTFLDEYGAEDPAEFLAVLTEAFFERPGPLRARYPDLYAQYARYYNVDPASWPSAPV